MTAQFGLRPAAILAAIASPIMANAPSLAAQAPWTERSGRASIGLELQKPSFADADFGFATGAAFLSGRVPIGGILLVGELPAAFGAIGEANSTSIGNPYLGVELRGTEVRGDFGVRLPTASVSGDDDFATGVGVFSDFDRFEAFGDDLMTVKVAVHADRRERSGFGFGGTLGSALLIPTKEGDAELFVDYALRGEFAGSVASVGAEFTGRLLATEDLDIGERTVHQIALGAGVDLGPWRPGIYVRLPLDHDLSDTVNSVIGVTLAVTF